ncbi:MAG: hypothetical protein ACK5HP_02675 [Bacilli bacterium]
MDLIILLLLMVAVIFFFRNFRAFVFFLASIEIIFHILTYIKLHIGVAEVTTLIDKYIPESILAILSQYTSGLFYDILAWLFLACFIVFEINVIKILFKKKK